MSDRLEVLRLVELFEGLSEADLRRLDEVSHHERYQQGETIFESGQSGDNLYIVQSGFVEVVIGNPDTAPRTIVNLGQGQLFGEMALVDHGPRSATVRALKDDTLVEVISRDDFSEVCQSNTRIGYVVMHNLAADLSFKLRHRNLMDAS